METFKVSSKSNTNSVDAALAHLMRAPARQLLQAIGAGALNQAIKSIAIARGRVTPQTQY